MAGRLTERADKFAKRFVSPKPEADNRSLDEKMATFSKQFSPRLNKLRQDYKNKRST